MTPAALTPAELIAGMPAARRNDVRRLDALVRATVPQLAPHVRDTMLGYGPYAYRYKSGRSGEAARIAVGANARQISLHIAAMTGPEEYLAERFADRIGGGRVGRSCVRFSQLEGLDLEVVRELLRGAAELPPPGLVEGALGLDEGALGLDGG